MNVKRIMAAIIAAGFVITSGVFAQEDELSKNDKQKSEEIQKTEKYLDGRIKELNDLLKFYVKLKDADVKLTPGKTVFTDSKKTEKYKNENFVELESYSFIPASYISNESVGTRRKAMRLYYAGENLSKIETSIIEDNFRSKLTTISVVIDPSPASEDTNDIVVRTLTLRNNTPSVEKMDDYLKQMRDVSKKPNFNLGDFYEGKLSDMQNTISNPLRVRFKRTFYVKNLRYFEKIYRFTEDFYRRYGKDSDAVTIETLKESLQY